MLTVDVTSIREHAAELKNLAEEYETTTMNIALEVNNMDPEGWHDDNSASFFAEAAKQKIEIQKLVSSIELISEKYDTIADLTVSIDSSIRTVFCDGSFQSSVKSKYDASINKINSVLSRLQGCSTYFCTSGERSAINSAKNSLSRAITKLKNSSEKVDKLFTELKQLEKTIKSLLTGMNVETASEIDLSSFMR